jgi:hypothetical protein
MAGWETCGVCQGSGSTGVPPTRVWCFGCGGTGQVYNAVPDFSGDPLGGQPRERRRGGPEGWGKFITAVVILVIVIAFFASQ